MRAQNGGQNTYLGIYFWNSGSPVLRLYKRSAGNWTQLGSSYNSGPLAAGTQLKLMAVGSTDLVPARRHRADRSHRHQPHRRRTGDHVLRHQRKPTTGQAEPPPPRALPDSRSTTGAPTPTGLRHTTSPPPTTDTAPRCCGSWLPRTLPLGYPTISSTCSRLRQGWVPATGTGWRPCVPSMHKTSTT